MAKNKKNTNEFGQTTKQAEAFAKLQEFMKKQSKSLDFSLGGNFLTEREGRNGATPTTSAAVDLIMGGGIPKQRLTVIVGLEHTGKTTLMQGAMAHQLKKGTFVHYLDFEGAADGSWMKNGTGIDFNNYEGKNFFPIPDMPTGDDAFRYITRTFEQTSDLGLGDLPELAHLICLDSIPSLVPEDLLENDEAGSKPYIAIMLSKWMPVVRAQLKRANASMIAINQIRQKVRLKNPYEDPNYEPGGNAIRFLTDVKVKFDQVKPKHIDGRDHEVLKFNTPKQGGMYLETNPDGSIDSYVYRKVKTYKNRVFPPLKETFVRICTSKAGGEGRGIDPVFDTLYFLEMVGECVFHDVNNVEVFGKSHSYWDLKKELENLESGLRQEALAMLDSTTAYEKYAAVLGGDIGKPDTEENGEDTEG